MVREITFTNKKGQYNINETNVFNAHSVNIGTHRIVFSMNWCAISKYYRIPVEYKTVPSYQRNIIMLEYPSKIMREPNYDPHRKHHPLLHKLASIN